MQADDFAHRFDPEMRALWHLELLGCYRPEEARAPSPFENEAEEPDDWDEGDEGVCFDCGQIHDMCECHVGEDCGRWRNGSLSASCMKAGSEECDFECPYRGSLYL